jgi:hypothetical protein
MRRYSAPHQIKLREIPKISQDSDFEIPIWRQRNWDFEDLRFFAKKRQFFKTFGPWVYLQVLVYF